MYPRLPPTIDGIGDHTALLSSELAKDHQVTVLSGASPNQSLAGLQHVVLPQGGPASVKGLTDCMAELDPDWLLLQYNPFSYGKFGVAPWLPVAVAAIKGVAPSTKIALLLHEVYVPWKGVRQSVLSLIQRVQLRLIARSANVIVASTEEWAAAHASWGCKGAKAGFMPIGSNVPKSTLTKAQARDRLGIRGNDSVVAVFGTLAPPHRNLELLHSSLTSVAQKAGTAVYVGTDGSRFRDMADKVGCSYVVRDRPSAKEAADSLMAADIGLAGFVDGVSPRRGSFLALLQQGIPVVATEGLMTGDRLRAAAQQGAFRLVAESEQGFKAGLRELLDCKELRLSMGQKGRKYYEQNHHWPIIVAALNTYLREFEVKGGIGV